MTRLRKRIAERLKEAQNTAAMLTTFNDVDMSEVMELRKRHKDAFEKKHGVKLGFMGFFTKAVVQGLKDIPAVNAEIDGSDLIYKNYYHIGVAVGTDRGLGSNVGYFFTVYGLVLFVASPLGGRMVDRFGYLAMIPMLGCLVASMWLSSLADNLPILLIAAVVGGFAMGRPGRSRGRWP